MSFIGNVEQGKVYAPGWFLAHEECERKTREIPQSIASTRADGAKYVPMGTPFPSNTSSIEGLLYEDVDVTSGNMPGSVVLSGVVYEDRLPVELISAAKTALAAKGFTFVASAPSVTRPDFSGTTGSTGGTTGETEGTTGETA